MSREIWQPDLARFGKPHYLAIADAIAHDIRTGRLHVADRLPPQRELAARLGLNFTTVARGFVEAQRRGLIESRVGRGSFVSGQPRRDHAAVRPSIVDLTMNVPPEPESRALLDRMQAGLLKVTNDIPTLLRYQAFGGTFLQREAAVHLLSHRAVSVTPERLAICPGTHIAFEAVLGTLTRPGDILLCESLTYPGIRMIGNRLGLKMMGIQMDAEGIDPDTLIALCQQYTPKILYLNPTLLNPTTTTVPESRRLHLVEIARKYKLTILEDDAYGALPRKTVPAFVNIAPDITYYVASLSKCIGAGLRVAYLVAPDRQMLWPVSSVLRHLCTMASPLTTALSTSWIQDGTAFDIIESIRQETRARQKIAAEVLSKLTYQADEEGFHLWLTLPPPWQRSFFAARMRASDLSIVVSDAFTVTQPPPDAVRISLGGILSRSEVYSELDHLAHMLEHDHAADAHAM